MASGGGRKRKTPTGTTDPVLDSNKKAKTEEDTVAGVEVGPEGESGPVVPSTLLTSSCHATSDVQSPPSLPTTSHQPTLDVQSPPSLPTTSHQPTLDVQSPPSLPTTSHQPTLEDVQSPPSLPTTSHQPTLEDVHSPPSLPTTSSHATSSPVASTSSQGEGITPTATEPTPQGQSASPLPTTSSHVTSSPVASTSSQGEGITPTATEPTPQGQSASPLPTTSSHVTSGVDLSSPVASTSSQGEEIAPSPLKLWDRCNKEQWGIVSLSDQYKNLLKHKLCDLTENVSFPPLVPHLLQLDILDKQTRDTIQLNAIEAEQTLRLVEHLQRGPCWRLHGFLRALTLTNQGHIVSQLGLNPDVYGDVTTPSHTTRPAKAHYYRPTEGGEAIQISSDLLPGLLQHCGSYNRNLMKSSIFGHKDTMPIDLTEVWVSTNAACRQGQSKCQQTIGKLEMFKKLFDRHPPNTLSLEGPAGGGKSSFVENYAYEWSKEVIACEEKGAEAPCQGHLWKLVIYIPLGVIRGSFTEVIRDNLRCPPDLQQQMMTQITNDGDGVLIIGDGMDELRDQTSKQSLCEYTETCQQMVTGPKVLITARDDLLFIPHRFLDRELQVKGFTPDQGVAYMGLYFKVRYQITEHPVLDYASTHQDELEWVLTNPLQVHILSELTASGFLTLDDVKTLTTIKMFRGLDHLMATRDEHCRGVDAGSSIFYRACLRCLLNNERQITDEEVSKETPYLSLLTKATYRDQDYKERHKYGFPHEVIFEYCAMRGVIEYIKTNPANKKSLLLYLCSQKEMRNTLRLISGYISQFGREMFPDTVEEIIRCCLLLQQPEVKPCVKNELTEELDSLPSQIQDTFPLDLLSTGLTPVQVTKMDRMFDLLQDMFTEPGDCLKKYGWAPTEAKNGFWHTVVPSFLHNFIQTCVEQCSAAEREAILQRTIEHLLPCATHDHDVIYRECVVPVSGGRFVYTKTQSTRLNIHTWCVGDMVEALHKHQQLHQLHTTHGHHGHLQARRGRLNLAQQHDIIFLDVNSYMKSYWGVAPDTTWGEAEWTPALTQLMLQYDLRRIEITVGLKPPAPLGGLLSGCSRAITKGHRLTEGLFIHYGKVEEEELLQFLDWVHHVGLNVRVYYLTVVLAAGRDPAQWHHLHAAIKHKVQLGGGKVYKTTYVSATGEVMVKNYKD